MMKRTDPPFNERHHPDRPDPSHHMCVCVHLLYSHQLGGQRSPLNTTTGGNFVPSTQLNYSPTEGRNWRGALEGGKEKVNKVGARETLIRRRR